MKHHRAKDEAYIAAIHILHPLGVVDNPEELEELMEKPPVSLLEFFDTFEDALNRLKIDPICHDMVYQTIISHALDVGMQELIANTDLQKDEESGQLTAHIGKEVILAKKRQMLQRTMRAIGLEISDSLADKIDEDINRLRIEFGDDAVDDDEFTG